MKTKNLIISLGILFLVSSLVNLSYAINRETIIGEWHFDEGGGKVVEDSSGKDHVGSLKHETDWVDGKFEQALEFNGQNDCVQIPFKEDVPEEYTLSVWIYQISADKSPGDDFAGVGGYGQTILSSGGPPDNRYGFWLLSYMGEKIRFYSFEDDPVAVNALLTPDIVIGLEEWHHIAATAVKGEDSVEIWISPLFA